MALLSLAAEAGDARPHPCELSSRARPAALQLVALTRHGSAPLRRAERVGGDEEAGYNHA